MFNFKFKVLDKCLPMLPQIDRMAMLNANVIDLQWIADRSGGIWTTGHIEGEFYKIKTFFTNVFFFFQILTFVHLFHCKYLLQIPPNLQRLH